MTDKTKDKSKTKAPKSKIVQIHKDKKTKVKDIYEDEKDPKRLFVLLTSLHEHCNMRTIGLDNVGPFKEMAQRIGIRAKEERIERAGSLSRSQPNIRVLPETICEVFAIDLLEPAKLSRSDWIIKVYSHNKYLERKKYWESFGVKYIVDYDIQSIIAQIG